MNKTRFRQKPNASHHSESRGALHLLKRLWTYLLQNTQVLTVDMAIVLKKNFVMFSASPSSATLIPTITPKYIHWLEHNLSRQNANNCPQLTTELKLGSERCKWCKRSRCLTSSWTRGTSWISCGSGAWYFFSSVLLPLFMVNLKRARCLMARRPNSDSIMTLQRVQRYTKNVPTDRRRYKTSFENWCVIAVEYDLGCKTTL